jgi:hypothetical protein
MGLKLSDLSGKMKKVEIIDVSQTEKDGNKICVLKVKDSNKTLDIGLFGDDVVEKILEQHGVNEKGKNFLEIPESKIKENVGMIWFNTSY